MAKKKVTKAVELDTIVTKTEEIGNDSAQLVEQSQSETDSTQVGGNVSALLDEMEVVAENIKQICEDLNAQIDAPKTSQEAQEGVLEPLAIGEPTLEPEQVLKELIEPSGIIVADVEGNRATIAPSEELIAPEQEGEVAEESEEEIVPEVEMVEIEVSGVDYIDCVGQILYAGSLGAKINPNYRPQLKRVPYSVNLLIPIDTVVDFFNKVNVQDYDENIQYNEASLSSVDVGRFVEQLLEAGEDGAILTPKKPTNNFVTFAAALSNVAPFRDSATVQSAAVKRYYTYKELHEFNLNTLKIVASWYKVRKQPKWLMVQQILKAQRERQEHEERTKLDS